MANTASIAKNWVRVLAARPEFPFKALLLQHFERAEITHLCDCGCNSFECNINERDDLLPLFKLDGKPWSLEAAFESNAGEPIEVRILADERGFLSGIDICLGLSNHGPVPKHVKLGKLLFTIPEL